MTVGRKSFARNYICSNNHLTDITLLE